MQNTFAQTIAFGGGCHWCTEAVFLALKGVAQVEQGWVASTGAHEAFSEGVIVQFEPSQIGLETLIAVHLYTHSCTANHTMRVKYRSAVYVYSPEQKAQAERAIAALQPEFERKIITQVLPFSAFTPSRAEEQNYYFKNPRKPFCETYIDPKLRQLMRQFSRHIDTEKLTHLTT